MVDVIASMFSFGTKHKSAYSEAVTVTFVARTISHLGKHNWLRLGLTIRALGVGMLFSVSNILWEQFNVGWEQLARAK